MKQPFRALLLALAALSVVELTSSYFLYRYYSIHGEHFQPKGFATYFILDKVLSKMIAGRHPLKQTTDNGPLFSPSPDFGYVMNSGEYEITETFGEHVHKFHLGVDQSRRRITSYAPVQAFRRIFLTGESGVFGWGLNDQETIGWLLQERLMSYEVINMSATGYSTVNALEQLRIEFPIVNTNDIVILPYHPVSNDFNVLPQERLTLLSQGYEAALGEPNLLSQGIASFGAMDQNNAFEIRKIKLSCGENYAPDCVRPKLSEAESQRVTEGAFDQIISSIAGRLVIAFLEGPDDDPVIRHLKMRGLTIVDLRTSADEQELDDVMPTNTHSGPFRHHHLFVRLVRGLHQASLIE